MEPCTKDATDGPCQLVGVKKYILICLALWGNYLSLRVLINFHRSFQGTRNESGNKMRFLIYINTEIFCLPPPTFEREIKKF